MPQIVWSTKYSVNIKTLDEQHQKLIGLLNRLDSAVQQGQGRTVLGGVLDELIAYTVYHFKTEEELFTKYEYPGIAQHVSQHEQLTAKVSGIKQKYDAGQTLISIQVLNFLSDWLTTHIQGSDKQYGPFLNQAGIK